MIKISQQLQFDDKEKDFIFNGDRYSLEKVENTLKNWDKLKVSNVKGNTFARDSAIKKKDAMIKKLIKITDFKNLHKLYSTSHIARSIKSEYNKTRTKKYTIQKFYKDICNVVKIEIKNDVTEKLILQPDNSSSYKNISIRVVGIK